MTKSRKKSSTPSNAPAPKCYKGPISKLPDGVLCRIFHLLRLSPPVFKPNTFFSFWEYQKKDLEWISVSWVCRHWRSVAFNDAALWAEPPVYFPRWTDEMLQRSKDTGLSVQLGRTPNHTVLSNLFGPPLRIAHLTMSDKQLEMLLSHFPLSSAPKLETLSVEKSSSGQTEGTDPSFRIPGTIFVDAIHLRHLKLAGVDIHWNSHLLPSSLQVLDLGQISPTARPTMTVLRAILNRMSRLQTLKLHQALPVEHSMTPSDQDAHPVLLESLQHLSVGHKPLEIAAFFDNITFSNCMRNVNVVVSLENGPDHALDCLLASARRSEVLGRFIVNAQSVAINGEINGIISMGKWQEFILEVNATEVLASSLTAETSDDDLPGLDFKIRSRPRTPASMTPTATRPFRCVFTSIFNSFEWSNVRELTLVDLDVKSYPDFTRVFAATLGALTTVHTIAIGPGCIDHFLAAASYNPSTTQSSTSIAFMGLTEIMVVEVPLQSRYISILGMLLSRGKRGFPMRKVGFEDCRGKSNKHMKLLGEIVEEVEWDDVKV